MPGIRATLRRWWKWRRNVHVVLLRDRDRVYLAPAWWPPWRVDEAQAIVRLRRRENRRRDRAVVPAGVVVLAPRAAAEGG